MLGDTTPHCHCTVKNVMSLFGRARWELSGYRLSMLRRIVRMCREANLQHSRAVATLFAQSLAHVDHASSTQPFSDINFFHGVVEIYCCCKRVDWRLDSPSCFCKSVQRKIEGGGNFTIAVIRTLHVDRTPSTPSSSDINFFHGVVEICCFCKRVD